MIGVLAPRDSFFCQTMALPAKVVFTAVAAGCNGQNSLSEYTELWVALGDDMFQLMSSITS